MSWGSIRPRVSRRADGRYDLRLPQSERAVLAQLPEGLGPMLESARAGAVAAPEAARLFPPAYPDDPTSERAYRDVVHQDLVGQHRAALDVLAATVGGRQLDEEQAACWMSVLNDVRLVLGTTLGVREEGPPPLVNEVDRARWSLYQYLSLLLEQFVEAMTGALPPALPDADERVPDDPWGEPPEGLRWSTPGAPATNESVRAPRWPPREPAADGPEPAGETAADGGVRPPPSWPGDRWPADSWPADEGGVGGAAAAPDGGPQPGG